MKIRQKALPLIGIMASTCLLALPQGQQVISGEAAFNLADAATLQITAADKSIIHYDQFHINHDESVHFLQPSKDATVLNRVTGGQPSQILGQLSGNGRVFLVNARGVYFGPDAIVDTASFVVSTLQIEDVDFRESRYNFLNTENSGAIINEGLLHVSDNGSIALLAPQIEQRGIVQAKAGHVLLAAAEKVALDFSGDGLLFFALDGPSTEALIEQSGIIAADGGVVCLSLGHARRAIQEVVNSDGITVASAIDLSGGVIRLTSSSTLKAQKVHIEGAGAQVTISGLVDVAQTEQNNGIITLTGEQVYLKGATLDASGQMGGGQILIGGDYQGQGPLLRSSYTEVDRGSRLYADAYTEGDGGTVVVWSDDSTLFNGQIFARGGRQSGNGGLVETSGKLQLAVHTGQVDTSAAEGNYGTWLLDPSSVNIATGGGATISNVTTNCANDGTAWTIAPATLAASPTTVVICAQNGAGTITVTNEVVMTASGAGLTFNTGTVFLNDRIRTTSGPVTFNAPVVIGTANIGVNTIGGASSGANIFFGSTVNSVDTSQGLSILAGTGTVTFTGAVGGSSLLSSLNIVADIIVLGSAVRTTGDVYFLGTDCNIGNNITTTNGGTIQISSSTLNLATNITLDTTNGGARPAGADIGITQAENNFSLTLTAGSTGNASTTVLGFNVPLASFTITASTISNLTKVITVGAVNLTAPNGITLDGLGIATQSGAITLNGPILPTSNFIIIDTTNVGTSAGGSILYNGTINGARPLTSTAGSGTVTFASAVGGSTPLTILTTSGGTINQNSTVNATGAVSYTASTATNVGGNITAGSVAFSGPVILTTSPTISNGSTNGAITFGGTVAGNSNGTRSLNITGGTGIVTFNGALGGTNVSGTALSALTVASAATVAQNSSVRTAGAVSYTASAINLGGTITTSGSAVGLNSPVTLTNASAIDTTNGGNSPSGGALTFLSTINGTFNLSLTVGSNPDASTKPQDFTPLAGAFTCLKSAAG